VRKLAESVDIRRVNESFRQTYILSCTGGDITMKTPAQVSTSFSNRNARLLSVLLAMTALLSLSGCGRGEVQVYRVAKEAPESVPPTQMLPLGHPDSAPAMPRLKWNLPAGWEEQTPGEMRAASFKVKGQGIKQADVSVVPLPGMAGGDFNNVNRWRSQVGLPSVKEEELAKLAQEVEIAGSKASLYDQAGENPATGERSRILAVVLHREGIAWFFKMTGDDELLAQQKPVFVEFLKSIKFEAQEVAVLPPSHPPIERGSLPPGHPNISPLPVAAAVPSSEGKPSWQVPDGWKEIPGGQFLVAKFAITSKGNSQAAVNVSMSAGDGGGLMANVNRWRQQLGLAEIGGGDLPKVVAEIAVQGGKATLVELDGIDARTGQKAKLLGALVPQAGQTWFYKLMGDAKVVGGQKDAFTKFVQTVKY
jgi:hypothetical protein